MMEIGGRQTRSRNQKTLTVFFFFPFFFWITPYRDDRNFLLSVLWALAITKKAYCFKVYC
ncbi:hypothetical protein RchiOBHm_Chr6g0270821 [Rosa chinensis]|uniref:Uncharacterized protein n=1 Tax=Rosa chinensis TaxID=74649 RepID=A0A2P6PQU9_ROSCH|nr:hypothetical protein RchiOBHm_Chr6g0270821 [Rosa chinensis]